MQHDIMYTGSLSWVILFVICLMIPMFTRPHESRVRNVTKGALVFGAIAGVSLYTLLLAGETPLAVLQMQAGILLYPKVTWSLPTIYIPMIVTVAYAVRAKRPTVFRVPGVAVFASTLGALVYVCMCAGALYGFWPQL